MYSRLPMAYQTYTCLLAREGSLSLIHLDDDDLASMKGRYPGVLLSQTLASWTGGDISSTYRVFIYNKHRVQKSDNARNIIRRRVISRINDILRDATRWQFCAVVTKYDKKAGIYVNIHANDPIFNDLTVKYFSPEIVILRREIAPALKLAAPIDPGSDEETSDETASD